MKIAVVGTGYVGLVSGVCLAEAGHDVVCVDVDPDKVAMIRSGLPPIHEDGLEELLRRHVGVALRVTTDLTEAVMGSEISMIAVGTPFGDGRIDLGSVRRVAEQIGSAMRRHPGYHVVVVKSTVVPGTTEDVVMPILESSSGRTAGVDFGIGMNPEFLTEGQAVSDFLNPDRIVLGGIDDRTIASMAGLYESYVGVPVIKTNPRTAEMIKYASNTLLATMISFSNEMANFGAGVGGVDITAVMRGVHLSRYLTSDTGETAQLSSFLYPGCGYGGSCLPKDTKALIAQGDDVGVSMRVLRAVDQVNEAQPDKMLDLLRKHFADLVGIRVGVLGLAFRPGTDDMRESPAISIIHKLLEAGVEVRAHDPVAIGTARTVFAGEVVKLCEGMSEAVQDVDAVMLLTRWDEFGDVTTLIANQPVPPVLIDGRRMIAPDAVARYAGIGM